MSHFTESEYLQPDYAGAEPLEFDLGQSATVSLTPADIAWATQVSEPLPPGPEQWQAYLQAIALRGLQHWLAPSHLTVEAAVPPLAANGIPCRIGEFRLFLLAQGSLSDEVIPIPQSLLAPPEAPHLYLLVNVQDEADQVTVLAGLRSDRCHTHQAQTALTASNGLYWLPVEWFDSPPEEVLLLLTCLQPEALSVPAAAAAIAPTSVVPTPMINVGRWLRDQLDTVAQQLAWTLLPPLATRHALMSARTPVEELESLLADIETAVTIPDTARGAYTDCQTVGLPFRLYALTWTILTPEPEWSLLLILGPGSETPIPQGTQLIVSDRQAILAQQVLTTEVPTAYLYAQVFGTPDDQFTATVQLPNGHTLNWPPFGFRPE